MNTINFKIDYNSVKTTNPEMGSEALARKSRYILENKLVFDDPVILIIGIGAWVVAAIAIAKPAFSYKNTVISYALCTFSLVAQLFEISRRVNLGDYAAIEDTIRAVIIASIVLVVVTIILNIVALVKSKENV